MLGSQYSESWSCKPKLFNHITVLRDRVFAYRDFVPSLVYTYTLLQFARLVHRPVNPPRAHTQGYTYHSVGSALASGGNAWSNRFTTAEPPYWAFFRAEWLNVYMLLCRPLASAELTALTDFVLVTEFVLVDLFYCILC